jgi:DNA-binding LytR/AlgR family response regulator
MIEIVVCDDDEIELSNVKRLLTAFHHEGVTMNVTYFQGSSQLCNDVARIKNTDIFLLDIVMPEHTGIELGKLIREHNKEATIIYLTSSNDYALDAYGLKALDYLLKPIHQEDLFHTLNHALSFSNKTIKYFTIQTRDAFISVKIDDIKYVEYRDHVLYFSLEDKVIKSKFFRSSFELTIPSLFENDQFTLSHRAYLVNMNHIKMMQYDGFIVDNDDFVPISKNRISEVRKQYMNFCLRGKR